jgi:hypothetical protein
MIFPKTKFLCSSPLFLNSAKPREISPQKRTLKKKMHLFKIVPNFFAPKKKKEKRKKEPRNLQRKGH